MIHEGRERGMPLRPLVVLLIILLVTSISTLLAQEKTKALDWDAAYEEFLESDPSLQKKIESGQTNKQEVIAWMRAFSVGMKEGFDEAKSKSETGKDGKKPTHNFPATASEYAKMVEPDLGVPPVVDLNNAIEIPIYVGGVQAYGNLGNDCDNPTFLGKATVSGSRLQRYQGQTATGKPLPDVMWIAFARNSSFSTRKVIGSVQMIGYNKRTGATAFFESSDRIEPWVTLDPDTWLMQGKMPSTDEPREFNRAFRPPGNVQCVECHQNDPFITNSFINAAKIPGTDESVVPALDQDSPYYVIGGENWDMRTIAIKGNACFDCHRVGQGTLKLFMSNGWDPNEHMPPDDPGSLSGDLNELLEVLRLGVDQGSDRGPENSSKISWVIPPAAGEPARQVGKDYPYKASFNELGRELRKKNTRFFFDK
ncbi:MAG: hypothetical protein AAF483_21120 [Planctomycetota bacterium]